MYFPGTFVNHLEGDPKNGHIDFYVIQNIRIFGFMENVKVQENPLIYAFRKAQGSIFDCSIYKIYVFRKRIFSAMRQPPRQCQCVDRFTGHVHKVNWSAQKTGRPGAAPRLEGSVSHPPPLMSGTNYQKLVRSISDITLLTA